MLANCYIGLKRTSITKSYDVPAIILAKEIIEKSVIDHWSLTILAAKAGINEFKLKIGFRELFGTSPYQYLLKLRLEKANDLLQETDLTISEIAYKTGFNSREGLTKAFRKTYKQSPREYRKHEHIPIAEKEAGRSLQMPKIPPLIQAC